MYPGMDFGREELAEVMRKNYDDIIDFVTQPAFKAIYEELMRLPQNKRPAFVVDVLLQPDELARRGVVVPEGILIQISAFGDRRPTLFAVKKFLPAKYHRAWENVNITFDNEYNHEDVSLAPDAAWRTPLPVHLQNAMLEADVDLESLPSSYGVNYGHFKPVEPPGSSTPDVQAEDTAAG